MLHTAEKFKKLRNGKVLTFLLLLVVLPLTVYQGYQQQILRQDAAGDNRPNVIIIYADDQPDDTLKYVPYVRDKLGNSGVTFTDAYATTGLCCPSRASLLTGQYAHNHRVTDNREPRGMEQFNDSETLAVWLKRAGYKTALIGKYLNEYDKFAPNIPPGWDYWFAFDDDNGKYFDYKITVNGDKPSKEYGKEAKEYSTDVFAEEAVDFIKKNSAKPFFLYFAPHTPHGVPRPAPRHEDECGKINDFPRNPSYNEQDVSDKPEWIRDLPRLSNSDIKREKEEFQRKMCTLLALDEAVEEMIQALGNKRENTIIVYMSDNGYVFGDHRWTQKVCFYRGCIGVDLIFSYPRLTRSQMSSNSFALNIDIAPTILELTGAKAPENFRIDGKSLVPLLKDPGVILHHIFLIESWNKFNIPPGQDLGVQTKLFKYNKLSTGEEELYDLTKDPWELTNESNNPAYRQIKDVLSNQVETMVRNQEPHLPGDWIPPDASQYYNDEEYINRPTDSSDYIEGTTGDTDCTTPEGVPGVKTEIGDDVCVPKDPAGFARVWYQVGLGLIGGLVVLFIIIGGYLMLTSEGRPQRLNNGKKFIFYALFGLGLAIFGYVFIEVIAIDILHLPGFTR